jgi:hypothetical protein
MGEVAEHRAVRWLEELDKTTGQSAKERLADRMGQVTEDECEDCEPEGDHLVCPNYEYCKAEFEAEWPEKKS